MGFRRSLASLGLGFAAALFLLTWARPAFADVRSEARVHFRRGMSLIAEGRIEAGVAELERAYETLPHPNVLYNIASAYAESGRYELALEYFERYLASEPPDVEEVRAIVAAIQARLAQAARTEQGGTTETPDATEQAPTGGRVVASADEILALDEAANQIETLAEVAQSETLRMRAARLRRLASDLRDANVVTETGGQASTETPGTGPDPSVVGEGFQVGGQSAGGMYEETVVGASRFAQNPLDAPNSTTIITRQDIRLSGLTNLGELLRRAAGVDVMRVGYQETQVGIRGFNQLQSPRVLFLINGRSTYLDAFGSTFLGTQPINITDIERIEVIRGPASALYGANGFSGVVNIVTRAPGQDPGTEAMIGVGNRGQVLGTLSTSGRQGRLGYRISAGYDQGDRFSHYYDPDRTDLHIAASNPDRALQAVKANVSLDYRLSRSARAYAEAGTNYGTFGFAGAASQLDMYATGDQSYAMTGVQSEWGGIRAFWNHFGATADQTGAAPFPNDFSTNTIDLEGEFAREFHLVVDHNLHLGLSYRRKQAEWNLFPEPVAENHFAVFFQDTMKLAEPVSLVLGFRVDRHPLLANLQFSPRGALILRPTEETAFRISAGRAFRTQTFLESYLLNQVPTPIPAISAVGIGSVHRERFLGSPPLAPEEIISTEAGFSMSTDYFTVDVSGYLNRVTDLIILVQETQPFTFANVIMQEIAGFNSAEQVYPFGLGGFGNDPARFTVVGGELSARVFPVRGLDIYANYAINKTFLSGNPLRESERRTSLHKINAGVQYRSLFGLDFGLDFHYASEQVWPEQTADATTAGISLVEFALPAYYLINARVGYRLLDDRLELGVAGYNVTNNRHRQHPFGQLIDTRVMGTVAYRF